MSTNRLISHIDLDGASCVIIGRLFDLIDQDSDVDLLDYKDIAVDEGGEASFLPLKEGYNKVYYTDLHLQDSIYNLLVEFYGGDNCFFFDHHQETALLADKKNVYFDLNKCGTRLFYEFLKKGKRVPTVWSHYVSLVDVYDRWVLDHPLREESENLNRVMYRMMNWNAPTVYGKLEKFISYQTRKLMSLSARESGIFEFSDFEKHQIEMAKEKEDREYQYALDNVQKRTDSKGATFLLFHGASKISYICNRMLVEDPSIRYVVCISTYTGNPYKREITGKVSVRSREGEFNCPDLEGINGHSPAAGGELDPEFVRDLLHGKQNDLGYKEE